MKTHLWIAMQKKLRQDASGDTVSIGYTEHVAALSKLPKDVERSVASLADTTANLLERLWSAMLARVRYPKVPVMGLDGTSYYVLH